MVEADIQLHTERRQGGGVEQVRLLPGSPGRRAGYGGLGSLRYPVIYHGNADCAVWWKVWELC